MHIIYISGEIMDLTFAEEYSAILKDLQHYLGLNIESTKQTLAQSLIKACLFMITEKKMIREISTISG
jgi:hypothetical protein